MNFADHSPTIGPSAALREMRVVRIPVIKIAAASHIVNLRMELTSRPMKTWEKGICSMGSDESGHLSGKGLQALRRSGCLLAVERRGRDWELASKNIILRGIGAR